jgi:hypothetical protein
MKYLVVSILLTVFVLSNSFAGTIRNDVDEQKYLNFGQKFFCVQKLVCVNENEKKELSSGKRYSCVILNKHWCITVAHLAEKDTTCIKVIIGDDVHYIDKLIINKNYDEELKFGDIALGFCSKGFGDNVGDLKLYEEKTNIGQLCSIAGYGKYGNMQSGAKIFDYKIRAGSNKILYKYNDMLICDGSELEPTSLEFLPNVGDIGGGLFVNGKLAGITCLIIGKNGKANSQYGDEVGFVEIYRYLEWINNYVKKTQM